MHDQQGSNFSGTDHFFANESANITTLKRAKLDFYCQQIASFDDIFNYLKKQKVADFEAPLIPYSINCFLTEHLPQADLALQRLLPHLLAQSMPVIPELDTCYPATISLPLQSKTECYVALLIDVLGNKLALQPYEQHCDQENVTERQHALQAGKISSLLGMSREDVIAMTFHDIARPSISNATHGHIHHCKEGSQILKPLNLSIDYAGLHALAKHLLLLFCPAYKQLISPTSYRSFKMQVATLFTTEIEALRDLSSLELAKTVYKIMLMRLVDDTSKVSELVLKEECGQDSVQYMDDYCIEQLVRNQLCSQMALLKTTEPFEKNIDEAIRLLLRAKSFSLNPGLYEKFAPILQELEPTECPLPLQSITLT